MLLVTTTNRAKYEKSPAVGLFSCFALFVVLLLCLLDINNIFIYTFISNIGGWEGWQKGLMLCLHLICGLCTCLLWFVCSS